MNSDWLKGLTKDSIETGKFPLREVLEGCCFYPAAGFDGTPVRAFGQRITNFVYVDWLTSREELFAKAESEPFTGYRILGSRHVNESELNPTGFKPRRPTILDAADYPVPEGARNYPFASWFVWERIKDFGKDHGPSRFSFLYLRADGAAAYQVLFQGNKCKPNIVCSIRPGRGGLTSSNFDEILLQCIDMNPKGRPEFMSLWDGSMGEDSVWREICDFENPVSETTKDREHAPVLLLRVRQRS